MSEPNKMLSAIAEEAADSLRRLIVESSDEIQAAMIKAAQEAELQEAACKFNLAFRIGCDLDANKVTHTLSWSVKHTLEVETDMPKPDQPELFPKRDKAIEALKGGKP